MDWEFRQYGLARRMLIHHARSLTICRFTGVTRYRLRQWRRHLDLPDEIRFRGPSHNSFTPFFRTSRVRSEGACLALLCELFDAVPKNRLPFYDISTGEALCDVYETYRTCIPHASLPFEQLVLLAKGLRTGKSIRCGHCQSCGAVVLIDPFARPQRRCDLCRGSSKLVRLAGAQPAA